ncbi:MAG: Trk system potassium transporter TrkA [Epulopiscium sp.]|nr:Trk system potassium transporter TrkA [Candidatus Epulonipiscium sp.]
MKVMIVGAGKLGYKLAESMLNADIEVTIIEKNDEKLRTINDHLDVLAIPANGIEIEVLRELDIKSYDLLVAATGSDESNTIICSLAKKLGCKKTIARIRNPEYMHQLDFIKQEMGIDQIINPDLDTANEIVRYLLQDYTFATEDFAKGRVLIIDFNIKNMPAFTNKRISQLEGMDNLLILAIVRDGNIIVPNGNTMLYEDDTIHITGSRESINRLSKKLNFNMERHKIEKVMIFGGSKIGYYLAQKLADLHIKVSIIEKDSQRCKYLSETLNNVLVVEGDGTDMNLLEEEGLQYMDAFIGATDYDEANLLMSLMAKNIGVNKTIAKISRPNYVQIIDKLEMGVAVNPIDIAASNILKVIRGGKVVSVSLLLGGQAEVTEIIASQDSPIVGKRLADAGIPKGIIIGAVVHKGKVIIPNGDTIIRHGDRIIIFCESYNMPSLEVFTKPRGRGILSELWNN